MLERDEKGLWESDRSSWKWGGMSLALNNGELAKHSENSMLSRRKWVSYEISKLNLIVLQNRPNGRGGGWTIYYYQKDLPFLSGGPSHLLGSPCPLLEERCLSMPEIGEKERNYLFKSYTDLE